MSRRDCPNLVVFSGGTGGNALVEAFQALSNRVSYVLPISDNGGSTSEILRVLGGIGVGDLRSRLIRLIPDEDESTERFAIKALLGHRLSPDREVARKEWLEIVDGQGTLWLNISNEKGQAIRSFLREVNSELIKRSRPMSSFNFSTGSIGNLFLTGMRLFFGSIETAIFMFASVTGIDPDTHVFPIINTSHTTPIAARLRDGSIIAGQNAISHPSAFSGVSPAPPSSVHADADVDEDANLPGTLAALRTAEIMYDKSTDAALPSPIEEIYYINPYGQRMTPTPNPRVISAIKHADAIIYAPGSLYTSLMPLLVPETVGTALRNSTATRKIMILNGSLDRETPGYTATDFLRALMESTTVASTRLRATEIQVDAHLHEQESQSRASVPDARSVCTHIVYMKGPGAPTVNDHEISQRYGVTCVCVPGSTAVGGVMRYRVSVVETILRTLLVKSSGTSGGARVGHRGGSEGTGLGNSGGSHNSGGGSGSAPGMRSSTGDGLGGSGAGSPGGPKTATLGNGPLRRSTINALDHRLPSR